MTTPNIVNVPLDGFVPEEIIKPELSLDTPIVVHGISAYKLINFGPYTAMFPLSDEDKKLVHDEQNYRDGYAILLKNSLGPVSKEALAYALKYLRLAHHKYKSESSVTLMWRQSDSAWKIFVPLQIDCSGGSVTYIMPTRGSTLPKEIEHAEEDVLEVYRATQQDYTAMLKEGFKPVGTIHSHPTFSAYASGTDDNDESKANGLHLTFGRIHDAEFETHGRLTINGSKWDLKDSGKYLNTPLAEISTLAETIEISEELVDRVFERAQTKIISTSNKAVATHEKYSRHLRNIWDRKDMDKWDRGRVERGYNDMLGDDVDDEVEIMELDDLIFLRHDHNHTVIVVDKMDYYADYQKFDALYTQVELVVKEFQ